MIVYFTDDQLHRSQQTRRKSKEACPAPKRLCMNSESQSTFQIIEKTTANLHTPDKTREKEQKTEAKTKADGHIRHQLCSTCPKANTRRQTLFWRRPEISTLATRKGNFIPQ